MTAQHGHGEAGELKILAEGRYLRLIERNRWEYVERRRATGVVAITAVTPGGKLLLVEQRRVSMNGPVLELPAGLVGDEDADETDFAAAAARELLEETGWEARRMEWLTEGPSSSGLSNEVITFFRAHDLTRRNGGGGVGDERITVHEAPLAEIESWLAERRQAGCHIDPRIFIGLYFARQEREGDSGKR